MFELLSRGRSYFDGVNRLEDIQQVYGPIDWREGDGDMQYYHVHHLRFYFEEGQFRGVDIFFENFDVIFTETVEDRVVSFDKETSIADILFFLNERKLQWHIDFNESRLDYLYLHLKSKVTIVFCLYDRSMVRIVVR